jgi:hypothetical protein
MATSGEIPYLILLLFKIAVVTSDTIEAYACFKIDKEF